MANLKKVAKSPPGWSGWIEEQKRKGMSADEAFGIAWTQYNKGTKAPSKKKKSKVAHIQIFLKNLNKIKSQLDNINV